MLDKLIRTCGELEKLSERVTDIRNSGVVEGFDSKKLVEPSLLSSIVPVHIQAQLAQPILQILPDAVPAS